MPLIEIMNVLCLQVLLYVVDGAGTESREPADDLMCLVDELKHYDESLLQKPSFVFCNKAEIKGIYKDSFFISCLGGGHVF